MDGLSIEHLSLEAVAALVDGELGKRAEHRAKIHLVHCQECREEVRTQREAAQRLRETDFSVSASGSLIDKLKAIPADCSAEDDLPESEKHYAIGADGCRKPERLTDAMDLLFRRLGKRDSGKPESTFQ